MLQKVFVASAILLTNCCFGISDEAFFEILQAQRQVDAHTTKAEVADFDEKKPLPFQPTNGDEKLYADLRGNFNKTLLHLPTGFPNRDAYESLRFALRSGKPSDFLKILLGEGRRLVNPQASLAYTLSAIDGWINALRAPPAFASAEAAGEMVEVYWSALVRDVPFNEFSTNATVFNAIADLNTLSDFKGPKVNGMVTPGTFLRGDTPGDLVGPYISQFLYLPIPYGNMTLDQLMRVPLPGTSNDFMTDFTDWFTVANGGDTGKTISFDATLRFIRTPRDLCAYVHEDTPEQAALSALLILNELGPEALDPNNPYLNNPTQECFVTFGISQVMALTRAAVHAGLKTAWYQKWQVHRRLRPEEFGFYLQQQVAESQDLGIHPDLTQSAALPEIFATYNSYFLPQCYPEGSPAHPAYPSGHATFTGAAVTILKAFFSEDFILPNPVQPNAANTALEPYVGTLTIGGELNKLAANIALGRDHAGVHYRSDGIQGLLLGEKVAIDVLNNEAFLFNEDFKGFKLTKFDGTTVIVGKKK
jgi:hypothetical protein